jgi:glycosyltransferase involved in cell wall biosynthesis
MSSRPSICYVVPGHDLMTTMGPTRNVISLASALSEWADVTVAFRRIADPNPPKDLRVLEIQPQAAAATVDDAAPSAGYLPFAQFLRDLRNFAARELPRFDVVLEKSWLLSGYVSSLCTSRGQLAIPVENIVQNASHAAGRSTMKYLRLRIGGWFASRNLRRAPLIIAETDFLKREIAQHHHVKAERIAVVSLGVDKDRFHPRDRAAARRELGIDPAATVLTYVGVLDLTHNLEPLIRALGNARLPHVQLHVTGDGKRQAEYRELALHCGAQVVFHGKVPHAMVPVYLAAADLCLAPYDAAAFSSGELGYSTMKIPEYLAAGRPVVSVPSGRIRSLLAPGVNGFLFANTEEEWQRFLRELPGRERLAQMGEQAAQVPLPSWRDTAHSYFELVESELQKLRKSA